MAYENDGDDNGYSDPRFAPVRPPRQKFVAPGVHTGSGIKRLPRKGNRRQVTRTMRLRTLIGLLIFGLLVFKGYDEGIFDGFIKMVSESSNETVEKFADWIDQALYTR